MVLKFWRAIVGPAVAAIRCCPMGTGGPGFFENLHRQKRQYEPQQQDKKRPGDSGMCRGYYQPHRLLGAEENFTRSLKTGGGRG